MCHGHYSNTRPLLKPWPLFSRYYYSWLNSFEVVCNCLVIWDSKKEVKRSKGPIRIVLVGIMQSCITIGSLPLIVSRNHLIAIVSRSHLIAIVSRSHLIAIVSRSHLIGIVSSNHLIGIVSRYRKSADFICYSDSVDRIPNPTPNLVGIMQSCIGSRSLI